MQNVAEEICGEYLRFILGCDFVSYNVNNPDKQGEIDVVGIRLSENPAESTVYICEVAAHILGLQYVKGGQPDDYNRFHNKFSKNIAFAKKYFGQYRLILMLWSPIVKVNTQRAQYNTLIELEKVRLAISNEHGLPIEFVLNNSFKAKLDELKNHASKETSMFTSSVMRLYQIEMFLTKHLDSIEKRDKMNNGSNIP